MSMKSRQQEDSRAAHRYVRGLKLPNHASEEAQQKLDMTTPRGSLNPALKCPKQSKTSSVICRFPDNANTNYEWSGKGGALSVVNRLRDGFIV